MNARDLLKPLLAALKTPAQRRQVAVDLRVLADELERLAVAVEREQARPPAQRLVIKGKGGRPSTPSVTLIIRQRSDGSHADEWMLRLSRALYYAAGSPARLDVQRVGGQLLLVPARGDTGYKVVANVGGVHINVSGARDVIALEAGRYTAEVRENEVIYVA